MALPQEIRDEIVREHGYDPTQWDVAEDFSSFIPKQTPSIPQQPAETVGAGISTIPKLALSAPPTANTPLQTFGKTFLHEAPSAIGGGAAAAGVLTALGGASSLTGAGALVGIPLMIAGSYLGSRGVRSIQEAVEPESWRVGAEQAAAENPTAALLGGVATMPLAGFRPGRSTIDALKGGAKLLGGGLERTPAEAAALLNAAINAGLQPATEVAIAQAEGRQLPSAKELALSALLGATFTTPVGPYKKVFPEVNAPRRLDVGAEGAVTTEDQQTLRKAFEQAQFKAKKDAEYVKMQEEKLAQDLAEQQKIKTTLDAVDVEKLKAENAARALELQQQMGPKFGAAEARPKPRVVTETGKEIYPDYTGVNEQNKTEVVAESPADLALRREEARLAGEEEPKFQPESALTEEQNISQQLAERGLTGSPSAVMYQKFKEWGAELAGIKLEQDGTLRDANDKEVAGALIAKKGTNELLAKVNPNRAGLDTIPHEMLGHGFLRRLRESPRKSDQEFVRKFEDLVSKDSEYQRIRTEQIEYNKKQTDPKKKIEVWDPEEFIASKQGLEFIKDRVFGRGETEAKEFWRDLTSHIKTRFTKNATMEDFRRIFNYRGINQPKVKVTGVGEGRVVNARTQPDSALADDYKRYNELQASIKQMIETGNMDDLQKVWQESENIKNKYGGMPPVLPESSQRNQPESPLLSPEDERALKLSRKQEGRTPYPFTEKERQVAKRFLDKESASAQEAIDAELETGSDLTPETEAQINKLDQLPLGDEDFQRNQPESPLLDSGAARFLEQEDISGFKLGSAYPSRQFIGRLKNKVNPTEWGLLEDAGFVKYLQEGNDYKKTEDVVKWIRENGPRVEVHSYGMEGKVSEAKREYDKMTHEWYDRLSRDDRSIVNGYMRLKTMHPDRANDYIDEARSRKLDVDKIKMYAQLQDQTILEKNSSPRATSYYNTVSALPADQPMPEWTTSKEGKNVQRVDVVIPLEKGKRASDMTAEKALYLADNGEEAYVKKYGKSELWQPDNLHENLPNTLGWAMIQYKTGPKGEKIAFIAEVQSRWGQEVRKAKERQTGIEPRREGESEYDYQQRVNDANKDMKRLSSDHPLLRDYNRLILKAAIEQAKKEGATHIVVSDAETAMMTERHDLQELQVANFPTEDQAINYLNETLEGEGSVRQHRIKPELWVVKASKLPQEPGMRLNYDTVLPRIAEELTGSKGERVSLGEHKNAYKNEGGISYEPDTPYRVVNRQTGEIYGERDTRQAAEQLRNSLKQPDDWTVESLDEIGKVRDNLIFRNPDGTPKTDVSGMMYPIERTVKRPTMLGKGTPESRYQGESALLKQTKTPEFKKWFGDSKVVDKDGKPLVVYHGTVSDFNIFSKEKVGNVGFYFTKDPNSASGYARMMGNYHDAKGIAVGGDNVKPVFLRMSNPAPRDVWLEAQDLSTGGNPRAKTIELLKEQGYDGIKVNNNEYIVFEPTQIKSATGNIGTFDPNNPDIRYSIKSPLSPIRAEITKVREDFGPLGKIVAGDYDKGFQGFYEQKDLLTGELNGEGLLNPFLNKLNPVEWFVKRTNDDIETVGRKMLAESYGKKSNITLTPRQKEIEQVIRKNLLKSVALKNAEPNLRKTIADPNYYPQVPKDEVLNILLNKVGTPEYGKLRKDFYDYHKSIGTPDPEAKFKEFRAGYEKQEVSLASQFGPVDKSAGVGIPPSWAESSPTKVMPRFNNRYARRIAYERAINNHPDILKALDEIQGADVVKNVLQDIQGKTEYNEVWRNAAAGLVRAAMLGPLTGAKDFTSNLTLGLQHTNPLDLSRATVDAIQNFKSNWKNSFETGVNRHNFGTLEIGDGGIDAVSSVLRRSRDIMNSIQGRNILELTNRTIAFGQGKFLAQIAIDAGKKSRLTGQQNKFLQDFAPDWKKAKVTDEYLNKVAGRYARSVQGSYDYRGLPSLTQKGSLAPVLSLARWNVEKFNNFKQYVVEPAFKGNITPLLMSTLGMLIGGTAVQKLVEEVTGKKQRSPDWKEIAAVAGEPDAKVKEAIAYKLAVLASFSGYAGVMGDLVKSGMDVLNKNTPQTYGNPLLDGLANAGRLTGELVEALRDGNLDITADVLSQILEDYVQGYRLAINKVSPERQEKAEATNRRRDLRNWKNLTGQDVTTYSGERANPFMDKESREFKQTDDLGKALELLPGLVQNALEKSKGDPERLESELTKLKRNSYQLFPNPERTPGTFLKYLTYLQNSQGQEAAHEALMDYLMQTEINKVKSSLVPSL